MRRRRLRGLAIPVVLSLIVILVLIAMAVASTGIATLNMAGAHHLSQQSVFAAEAGLNAAFREIIQGNAWTSYSNVAYGKESRYWVDSFVGPAPANGQHPQIPNNTVYLLATGNTRGKFQRQVGVLIAGAGSVAATSYGYALSSGGTIDMQGGGSISGSLKSSGDIRLQGGIKIIPYQGSGRLLSGEDIDINPGIKKDPSQDMRARQTISGGADPARLIFPNDTTPASLPFINDGRFTNVLNAAEVGEILPNPNPVDLLGLVDDGAGGYVQPPVINPNLSGYEIAAARTSSDVVPHDPTETVIQSPASLNLGGKIHFFPNGIKFDGNNVLTGPGTVVVGAGSGIEIDGNQNVVANFIALRWPNQMPSGGNPSIKIQGNIDIKGLILAHENVEIQGNFHLTGMLVAYHGKIDGQGNRRITFDSSGLNLPGLQSWLTPAGPPTGPGTLGITPGQPIKVLSWQRL